MSDAEEEQDAGIDEFEDKYNEAALAFAVAYSNKGRTIFIQPHLVEEILRAAGESVRFHGIKPNALDHFKYAGHLSFWTARYRPVYFEFGPHYSTEIEPSGDNGSEWVMYKTLRDDKENYYKEESYPLNEMIAAEIAYSMIKASQLEILQNELSDSAHKKWLKSDIKHNDDRFHAMKYDLGWSLRKHNHTSRTWTTMLESTFKTPVERILYEKKKAEDVL